MPSFGIQPSGFVTKLSSDAFQEISDAMHNNVDKNFDMSPDQPVGQLGQITASEIAELWEIARVCYSGINPQNAEGFILDGVCAYTGTERDEPSYSTVVCAMGLGGSASIPAGSTANVSGQPTNTWTLLGKGDPATGLQTSTGPVTSTTAGTYYGFFRATQLGPVLANAGQLSVITTAVTGWNTVTNPTGCTLGANVETDSSLQTKRDNELAASGADTIDAIRAKLLEIKTPSGAQAIQQCFVYENITDFTDSNGVPPHSIHVILYDGAVPQATSQQIVNAIWAQKPSGINTYGASSSTVTDSEGVQHVIYFDRAIPQAVYISLSTVRGPTFDNVNGPAAIGAALVAYWAKEGGLGQSLMWRFISGVANDQNIQGLVDIPDFFINTTYSPVSFGNIIPSPNGILTLKTGVDGSGHAFILVDGVGV